MKRGPGDGMKLVEKNEFNESEIMGDIERDAMGLPINLRESSKGSWLDSKGKAVSAKGYLLDDRGNVINKEGKLMFRRVQMTKDGDLPTPASIGRFNFNPFKITGNFQTPKKPKAKTDDNKKPVNSQGFFIDKKKGHIINNKGKIIID